MNFFSHMGRYTCLLKKVFSKPEKFTIYYRRTLREIDTLGINSIGIVAIISLFMGAVITIQTAYNTENPFLPDYLIGLTTRDTLLLEFSSTIVCLILAGKVGSNIASEIGTMRVTEQIDALEVMGVNSASFLILPKVIGFVLIIPFLVIISMFIGIVGGMFAGSFSGTISVHDYIYGIQYAFEPFYITYSIIKSVFFAFIITSISSYYGYFVRGGALDVGRASTRAVVNSSVLILLFDLLLTQFLLG
ncbi:MAG: ABC transporter permease [Bacteroidetes bacterium]|nr:MAG: ABC transporter permease [Bacteroidota bacterium]